MIPTTTEILTVFYGRTPTDFEIALYNRLTTLLNRQPLDAEIGNMKTDTNLVMWVLSGQ